MWFAGLLIQEATPVGVRYEINLFNVHYVT
jgi:hypothetical protein